MMAFSLMLSCFVSTALAASGTWSWVRNVNQTKVECIKLNQHAKHYPKYDTSYATVEGCQTACLNQVPQCNTVNYSPSKKGKCQFEYCERGYKTGGTKHFNSYVYVGDDGAPLLPGTWMKIRDASEEKVLCTKLNNKAGAFPKYDTDYQTVDECQTACVTQVFDCNTVNYSPADVPGKLKKGKCQFEHCENNYAVGGTKHYDSWMYSGQVLAKPTTPGIALWTAIRDAKKFNCLHLNTARDANPQYNGIYANLEQCQDACAKTVPQCNVVNYAGQDTTDRAVQRGSCQFQFCNLDREGYQYENTENFQAYVYHGSPLRGSRPVYTVATRPAEITYDRDGWKRVGDARDFDLNCDKLNFGQNYDSRNGPEFNTKYDELWQCKEACKQMDGCDAINYSKDKEGKCQFLQCNGEIRTGKIRDFESYFLKRSPRDENRQTRPANVETRGPPITRAPIGDQPTRPPITRGPPNPTNPPGRGDQPTPAVSAVAATLTTQKDVVVNGITNPPGGGGGGGSSGTIIAVIAGVVSVVVVGAVAGAIIFIKIKKSSSSAGQSFIQ